MNILISNDDGIDAKGIQILVDSLSSKADIYVVAPEKQMSAKSHSITIMERLMATETTMKNAKLAYSVNGSPADCVKIGLKILEKKGIKIDAIFTGINHGGNLGTDCHYSGTVGAAKEGCLNKVRSVAMSMNNHEPKNLEVAGRVAVEIFEKVLGELNPDVLVNVNVPDLPENEIKGIKITKIGVREYDNWFKGMIDENGREYYMYSGVPKIYESEEDDMDVIAIQDGFISVTPIIIDWTHEQGFELLKKTKIAR